MRGRNSHGHGSSKKHRGAGHRGGKGKAGSGKRGAAKRMKITGGQKNSFGRKGFKLPQKTETRAVNIEHIQNRLNSFLDEKLIEKDKDAYVVDLTKLGFDKLLSKGEVSHKFKIHAKAASKNVIKKIKDKGGEVIIRENN